ncbi:unnamed protein product [Rotaria sordida]|uniref:Uncharacterized protein n=1 Tax=Rotaria sordida TaxID=392033 RepID=A0A814CGA6_9BILA|nr:unnamed protein product [Rotaria sordida]CAF3606224.1 unnamed protein product [Rotaria sordida]
MSYEESSFYQNTSGGGEFVGDEDGVAFDGNAGGIGYSGSLQGGAFVGGLEDVAQGGYASYESASAAGYGAEAVLVDGGAGVQASVGDLEGGLEQQNVSGAFLASDAAFSASSLEQQSSASAAYATDSQGLYQDPNPEVIRRPAPGGLQTYTQRVLIRFLQPPAVPPPGPLVIKEVRPPQPPPPPPLYIRQRPPPPPPLPPIVIREAPPKLPPPVGIQVITKRLPALPVPPRSVIIERLPPLPPKPRDIIVERWLPYRTQQKRRVIIQRAPPPVIPKPRNIIIYYEPPKAQVVRRFQNLGIQRANPAEYVARYGTQLEDAQTLLTQARQAGVVEDISPPAGGISNFQLSNYESYQAGDIGTGVGVGVDAANYGVGSSAADVYGVSGGFSSIGDGGLGWVEGAGLNWAGGAGGVLSNSYESSSSYNASSGIGGYDEGLGSSFGDLGLVDNTNNVIGGSYESYSSQQALTH